jgi:hypothetical protein
VSASQSLPPERFYWAILDDQGWSRAGPLPRGLLPGFADEVPIPMEELHAVCAPIADGKLLVCAAPLVELERIEPHILSLAPEYLPEFVTHGQPRIELLVGDFEPRPIRSARRFRHGISIATLLVASALVCVGLERRSEMWRQRAEQSAQAAVAMANTVSPGTPPDALGLELERLRSRLAPESLTRPKDASVAAAALLNAWPSRLPSKPQGLNVRPDSISVAVVLEEEPSAFLGAITAPAGWMLEEPRINATGGSWRVNLAFVPAESRQ